MKSLQTTLEAVQAVQVAQAAQKADKVRSLLRGKFGKGRFRIRASGAVDVYGQMPHSIVTGWWYYGNVSYAYERLTFTA